MSTEEKDLTLKQKKFLKVYFETGNATKAALEAYDTDDPNTASVIGAENLVKLRSVLRYQMDKRGLTLEKIVGKVDEATDATKWNDFSGEREPDHPTRLKAVEVAERWLGLKDDSTKVYQQFNVGGEMKLEFSKNDESTITPNTV
mgnify:CR=1 FL=1